MGRGQLHVDGLVVALSLHILDPPVTTGALDRMPAEVLQGRKREDLQIDIIIIII